MRFLSLDLFRRYFHRIVRNVHHRVLRGHAKPDGSQKFDLANPEGDDGRCPLGKTDGTNDDAIRNCRFDVAKLEESSWRCYQAPAVRKFRASQDNLGPGDRISVDIHDGAQNLPRLRWGHSDGLRHATHWNRQCKSQDSHKNYGRLAHENRDVAA